MIRVKQTGDFHKTLSFLKTASDVSVAMLKRYGAQGVTALSAATPIDSGLTASSWYYEVSYTKDKYTISFHNSNIQNGCPIAVILQYGHGTKNGGWVEGVDYINPSIQPIFDAIAKEAWREVAKR